MKRSLTSPNAIARARLEASTIEGRHFLGSSATEAVHSRSVETVVIDFMASLVRPDCAGG